MATLVRKERSSKDQTASKFMAIHSIVVEVFQSGQHYLFCVVLKLEGQKQIDGNPTNSC